MEFPDSCDHCHFLARGQGSITDRKNTPISIKLISIVSKQGAANLLGTLHLVVLTEDMSQERVEKCV